VAEDNATNQLVIRQMLTRMGFACVIGENGAAALRLYQAAPEDFGLLLTDFHMPEMDGFELTAEIRGAEQDGRDRLPIVALTADALTGTEEKCLAAGMDGYLTKPINSRLLGATLMQYLPGALDLRRPADAAPPAPVAAKAEKPSGPDWDTDILDPASLADIFGGVNAASVDFVKSFCLESASKIAAIDAALKAKDTKEARFVAHALKGAALSIGAKRLGLLGTDLQDALDADDLDTAELMAELLQPTLDELNALLPRLDAVAA